MSTHDSNDDDHDDHGGNFKYFVIFITLCILTAMSFFTYSSYWPQALDNETIKRTFMMAISCTKAMLVILFFMHVLWEANWKYALTIPASFMSLFLLLMLVPDVGLRLKHASRERRLHMAVPQAVDHGAESPGDHSADDHSADDHSADDHSAEEPGTEEPSANDRDDEPSSE